MSQHNLNPETDNVGSGTDSKNQISGQRVRIVRVLGRREGVEYHPQHEYISYLNLDVVLKEMKNNTLRSSWRRLSLEGNHYKYWTNWCLKEQFSLYNLDAGGTRVRIYRDLRKNGLAKALLSGKTVCRISSNGYGESLRPGHNNNYRCWHSYCEYVIVDGVEFDGKIFPL